MSVEFYEEHAESFIAQTASIDMQALYERFFRLLPLGGSILDAGCGSGRDALAFSRMGYGVLAFDASRKMVDATRDRTCVPVYQMTFEDMKFDQRFDGIWACASLLHVPRSRLARVLQRLSSHLKPEGALYASFKYGEDEREKGCRYFNDMNERLLDEHLKVTRSLRLLEVWITTDQRPERGTEQWLNCLLTGSA
jgi:2-polyprenyl-3-methyl-5-hydroxy-6-metoxy-1,4-benzoquinol methylase